MAEARRGGDGRGESGQVVEVQWPVVVATGCGPPRPAMALAATTVLTHSGHGYADATTAATPRDAVGPAVDDSGSAAATAGVSAVPADHSPPTGGYSPTTPEPPPGYHRNVVPMATLRLWIRFATGC